MTKPTGTGVNEVQLMLPQAKSRSPWKFRRCPHSRIVQRASLFAPVGTYRPAWRHADAVERH